MSQERYFIGPGLRAKLRETIQRVDGLVGSEKPPRSPIVHQEMTRGGGPEKTRFGEVSAAWNKGAIATVTRLHPDGSDYEPSQTFSALNQFAALSAPAAGDTRFVMCVLVENTWMLVAAEC
jgi:hypothetical protein